MSERNRSSHPTLAMSGTDRHASRPVLAADRHAGWTTRQRPRPAGTLRVGRNARPVSPGPSGPARGQGGAPAGHPIGLGPSRVAVAWPRTYDLDAGRFWAGWYSRRVRASAERGRVQDPGRAEADPGPRTVPAARNSAGNSSSPSGTLPEISWVPACYAVGYVDHYSDPYHDGYSDPYHDGYTGDRVPGETSGVPVTAGQHAPRGGVTRKNRA